MIVYTTNIIITFIKIFKNKIVVYLVLWIIEIKKNKPI